MYFKIGVDMIDNSKEYILCAAIHYKDEVKRVHMPQNIEDGLVVLGRGHHNCFAILNEIFSGILKNKNDKKLDKTKCDTGFLTSFDRYVDRLEGFQIALASGQVKGLKPGYVPGSEGEHRLCSEDLYTKHKE